MVKTTVVALLTSLAVPAILSADETLDIKRDPFVRDSYTVEDRDDGSTSTVKPDPFIKGQLNIYNENHRRIGDIKQDPFTKDYKIEMYDQE